MPPEDQRIHEFSELLQDSRSRVFGFIYALVLNMADAEDLFQQTALLLWEKFDEFERGTDFTAWALRIARFKAANFMRSRYRQEKRLSSAAIENVYLASTQQGDESQEDRLNALRDCLSKLSPEDQAMIRNCYNSGGVKIKEIAAAMNKSANALYAEIHRIRKALLKCIKLTMAAGNNPKPMA